MFEAGEFVAVPEKLLRFRRHSGSISRQKRVEQQALTLQIAQNHCHRFMSLEIVDGGRAAKILCTSRRERKLRDWMWFLTKCAPRLRWKSKEAFGWLAWQTVKQLAA